MDKVNKRMGKMGRIYNVTRHLSWIRKVSNEVKVEQTGKADYDIWTQVVDPEQKRKMNISKHRNKIVEKDGRENRGNKIRNKILCENLKIPSLETKIKEDQL